MTTLSSTKLIPELQTTFYDFVTNDFTLNKDIIPFPVRIADLYLNPKSFLFLLFSDSWSNEEYNYLYKSNTNKFIWPEGIRTRLGIYPASAEYFNCVDTTSISVVNIFSLKDDDFLLLDKLLEYRLATDSTSVTLIGIDYDSLTTTLSKLIFLYLDMELNHEYSKYSELEDGELISGEHGSILEYMFETYLIETYFKYVSQNLKGII